MPSQAAGGERRGRREIEERGVGEDVEVEESRKSRRDKGGQSRVNASTSFMDEEDEDDPMDAESDKEDFILNEEEENESSDMEINVNTSPEFSPEFD